MLQPLNSTPTAPLFQVRELACRRGNRILFKDLAFDVEPGQVVWIRGQNGRGKTSLLRLAAGLSTPEHGSIRFGEEVLRRFLGTTRRQVFIGHANALKEDLSVSEALAFLLRIHGCRCDAATVMAALERIGLSSRRNAMVRTLSQGQRRRVALARLAVERGPSLWILDEPFDALDTDGMARVNGLLAEHVARGGSVLLTSHLNLDTAVLHPVEVDLDRHA